MPHDKSLAQVLIILNLKEMTHSSHTRIFKKSIPFSRKGEETKTHQQE